MSIPDLPEALDGTTQSPLLVPRLQRMGLEMYLKEPSTINATLHGQQRRHVMGLRNRRFMLAGRESDTRVETTTSLLQPAPLRVQASESQ